ncbi:MAG: universal stress protein [Pseudomonadota bacterium]
MKIYSHILIATDLSDKCKIIGDQAFALANKYGATLSIVHVVEFSPVIYGGEYALPLEYDIEEAVEKQAREKLEQQAKNWDIQNSNCFVEKGSTVEGLYNLVHDKQVDLLVIGNHHYTGLSFLLGSTANTLFHKMPCDILATRID